MEPSEALSTAAQVAVALAGFAGVVVVFRSRSVHEWSKIDKFRLQLLLTNSAIPLTLCMVGQLLLAANVAPAAIWRWSSGFAAVLLFPMAIVYLRTFRSFSRTELETASGSRLIFYAGALIGAAVTVLQLVNLAMFDAFWPFFLAIVSLILASLVQFVRLVLI
jgi:hypothetical protein